MSTPTIDVITLTRHRWTVLPRAIASVAAQECDAQVAHHIVVDDCPTTAAMLRDSTGLPPGVAFACMPRTPSVHDSISRAAQLRNLAVQASAATYIAFLDDDNTWTMDHLATLLECIRRDGVRAAHSWLEMLWPDGSPYLEARKPWSHDEAEGRARYRDWVRRGVFRPGSNIAYDRMDPLDHPDPARTVDMGEWLIERDLLLRTPLSEEYDETERETLVGEDDKLMADLLRHNERVSCTGRATLRYHLGGFTNQFAATSH